MANRSERQPLLAVDNKVVVYSKEKSGPDVVDSSEKGSNNQAMSRWKTLTITAVVAMSQMASTVGIITVGLGEGGERGLDTRQTGGSRDCNYRLSIDSTED